MANSKKQEEVTISSHSNSKIRVYAKSQKWCAMGIVAAYLKMYPHAQLEDINKAFPRKDFVDSDDKRGLFDTWENLEAHAKSTKTDFDDNQLVEWKGQNYYLTLNNGKIIGMTVSMWTKEMFDKMLTHAKLYDIEIAQYEAHEKGIGKRGEYSLEYLNGYIPPKPEKSKTWLWILLAAIVIIAALLCWFCLRPKEVVEVEKIVEVHDTLYIQQIEEIEKNFNAAEFVQGKADLSESAKFVLHDLAKVMEKNPQLKLCIEGHTSAEGEASFNQALSETRAKAAVDFLVEHENIDANRLEAVGLGSSKLKNAENPMASENRRTEFIVIE